MKAHLENRLHDMIRTGQINLRTVQRAIGRYWETLYRRVFGAAPRI